MQLMKKQLILRPMASLAPVIGVMLLFFLGACTPSHDWREIHGDTAPYSVLLPAKPTSQTRQITLSSMPVTMTMTAAEVEHVTYAVGTVELANPVAAKQAMRAMKDALAAHLDGATVKEHIADTAGGSRIDLEASGSPKGEARVIVARFEAHDRFAYQAIVTGPKKVISRDNIDTFITSFKVK